MGLWIADGHLCVAVPPCQRSLGHRLERRMTECIRAFLQKRHCYLQLEENCMAGQAGFCLARVLDRDVAR
jgi:hypothetical protein